MCRSRAGASLDERFTATDDAGGVRLTVSAARTGDTNVYTLQVSMLLYFLCKKAVCVVINEEFYDQVCGMLSYLDYNNIL